MFLSKHIEKEALFPSLKNTTEEWAELDCYLEVLLLNGITF